MLTFLEVSWVGRDGGITSPLTVKGSDLWTKPVSSLYLREKTKQHAYTTVNAELLHDSVDRISCLSLTLNTMAFD